ncbi:5070_t:CDS:1, partial [Acaulospora morrowiae]
PNSVVKIATVFVGTLNFSGTATIRKLDLPSSYSLTNILLPTTNSKSPSTSTRSSRPVIHITHIYSETTQPTDLSNNIPSSAFSIKGYISLNMIF